ncbi:MAG: IS200/IS605 family transposase [Pyrinomonadaceae bacterium]
MAQTITSFLYHVVFSTKNRVAMIRPEIEDELFAYIGGILNNYDSKLIIGNGTSNHVHLLISLSKNVNFPDIIGKIKRDSSKWVKTKGAMLAKFGWQDGYSAFTVGHTQIDIVSKYVARQKEHHTKIIFEDEMRKFYVKYDIAFDEKYVWD